MQFRKGLTYVCAALLLLTGLLFIGIANAATGDVVLRNHKTSHVLLYSFQNEGSIPMNGTLDKFLYGLRAFHQESEHRLTTIMGSADYRYPFQAAHVIFVVTKKAGNLNPGCIKSLFGKCISSLSGQKALNICHVTGPTLLNVESGGKIELQDSYKNATCKALAFGAQQNQA